MKRLFKLTKSNIRTSKGTSICVFILLMCAALLFNIALILKGDYKDNFERLHSELYAEHVTVAVATTDSKYVSYVEDILSTNNKVKDFENRNAIISSISLPYNGADYTTTSVLISYGVAKNNKIGKIDFLQDEKESGIYLSYLFDKNGYDLNDIVDVEFGDIKLKDIKVVGFFNSVMAGSNNCGITQFILSDDLYAQADQTISDVYRGYMTSIRLNDGVSAEEFEASVTDKIKANVKVNFVASNNINLLRQSRYITQMISSLIILIIACLIVVIAIIISAANLSEYIKENLKKIGALKALGYVTSDIILSFIVQFVVIALVGSVIGVGLSYLFFPALNEMLMVQTGIPYSVHFILVPALVSIGILVLSIALTILLAGLRIRNIEAIDALREGITTHNFKKNVFPLNKKNIGLNFKLGLKSAFTNVRMNVTTILTTFLLTFVVAFDIFLLFNCVITIQPMVKMIVSITPDAIVYIDEEHESDILSDFNNDSRIKNYYLYTNSDVKIGDTPIWMQIVKDGKDVESDLIGKGKAPQLDNEVAIGWKYAKENNIAIGDYLNVSLNGKDIEYIVTGYTQNSNYLGKDALITRDGFNKFDYGYEIQYAIYLNEQDQVTTFLDDYKTKYNSTVIDYAKETSSFVTVYKNLLTIIFYAVIALTSLVLFFVQFLSVRSLLDKKKKEFGILKSLGYTTNELIGQTIISFIPSLCVGMLLGVFAGQFLMNPIFSLAMNSLGIFKCGLTMPFYATLLGGIALAIMSIVIVFVLSRKIKDINPYKLLIGE